MLQPRLLVTGASGFIGLHFRTRFGEEQNSLVDALGSVDLRDAARVGAAIASSQPEAVLHLAAQSSVGDSFRLPLETYAVNFLGTLNLLEALRAIDFKGVFVYVSSADVYGSVADENLPVNESLSPRPRSPYAVSKAAAELLCYQWSQTEAFRVVVVRPFNQIGPGHDARFAVPHFAKRIMRIRRGLEPPIITTGDLGVTRDFTDVRDTVRALKLVLDHGRNGETYNICSGRERSLSSILSELQELAGVDAEVTVDPSRLRANEQRRMVGDPSKIREHLGWVADIPIRTTLQDILRDTEKV